MKKLPLDGDTFIQMISSLLEGWSCIICEREVSLVVIAYIYLLQRALTHQRGLWTVDSGLDFLKLALGLFFIRVRV